MASVSTNKRNKTRMILFVGRDGKRKRVRLGKVTKKQADWAKGYIEDLLACDLSGEAPSRATADWLARLSPVMRKRIEKTGLIEPQEQRERLTLSEWLARYMESRQDTITKGTEVNCEQTRGDLLACFGADKPLRTFIAGDGDAFRLYLERKKLAVATVRRRCGRARQFFAAAVKRELIDLNPFDSVACKSVANPSRFHYVTRAEAEKVLNACPDVEWKLIFAFSRFGGLRCPSETLGLRWIDIDWEHSRIHVRSPKTAHFAGHESRDIPLFPELLPLLQEAFDEAEPGSVYIIGKYRDKAVNLRTRLARIIRAAGVTPWGKIFQNCRATRQTELGDDFAPHVVCAWLGNSEPVAMRHYLHVTDEHYRKAAGVAPSQVSPKAAHNAARYTSELPRKGSQGERGQDQKRANCGAMRKETAPCESTEPSSMTPRRLELRLPG